MNRRAFLQSSVAAAQLSGAQLLEVDPTPRYELSPYLYMHFMELLGATDGSLEATWNHDRKA